MYSKFISHTDEKELQFLKKIGQYVHGNKNEKQQ